MPTPNKYATSGRFYTQDELAVRQVALTRRYLILGYVNPECSFRWYDEQPVRPYNKGRNKAKRLVRSLGFKSLQQHQRNA